MIGQVNTLNQIDNLIAKGFPRFTIVTGQKGQGKSTLICEIAKKLKIPFINFGIKIDEIRELIELAYKQTEPIIYVINNADKMSMGAKNSLLKLVEEPPQQAYIIMELNQLDNTLETIKSRCQEIKMENYTEEELKQFTNEYYTSKIPSTDRALLLNVCQNKYQIDLMVKYGVQEFYDYIDKVYNNIYKVQSANSFKIAEKIDIKDEGTGYDLELFWNMYMVKCLQVITASFTPIEIQILSAKSVDITNKYKSKLTINGINKQALFDMWLLKIRKCWRVKNENKKC